MTASKAATRAKRKYNQKNYDRLELVVPIGKKEVIKEAAADVGESVNEFVNKAVLGRIGIKSWDDSI